jgi:hypothetical protein
VRYQIDLFAIGGFTDDPINGPREYPRMPTEEWLRALFASQ